MNLKKIGKIVTSKSVGTGTSFYKKRMYLAAVSQRLRNTDLHHLLHCLFPPYNITWCRHVLYTNFILRIMAAWLRNSGSVRGTGKRYLIQSHI